jgi:opacity protein-like surface antigen
LADESDAETIDTPSQQVLDGENLINSPRDDGGTRIASTTPDLLFASTSRAYIAPIIGPSWATLSRSTEGQSLSSANGNLFTAGGALGYTIPTERGQLRFEIEPRYRDSYTVLKTTEMGSSAFRTGDNWSVLANTWLDLGITNNFGLYAGGGVGGGGYTIDLAGVTHDGDIAITGSSKIGTFAWQAGGGAIYALSDRIQFDAGYRFYNVADGNIPVTTYVAGLPPQTGSITTSFTASELLFSVRIYDPLSRWTR